MKIGLQISDFGFPDGPSRLGGQLAAVARTAEVAGFDSISVMDHFFQIGYVGPPEREMLEAYTTLGYMAGVTSRVKLITMVTGAVYRHPGVLAKIISTLDVLSAVIGDVSDVWRFTPLEIIGREVIPAVADR
jgi:alkanesulfonate monooxygenase SsuD/methylene tetrahydromethanopterin reductase-like flavin-dependent oxidoreductase (luciferase family)